MEARYAKQIRQGIVFYELCQQNALLIEHARTVLTNLGYEAFLRLMLRDGHRLVTTFPAV